MVNRSFVQTLVAFVLATTWIAGGRSAHAQAALDADAAVRQALQRPEIEQRLQARMANARATAGEATIYAPPRLGLGYEQVFGDDAVAYREFGAAIETPLDLSGWRRDLEDAVEHREAALRSEAQSWELEIASAVRSAFYHVRYREERAAVITTWMATLDNGLTGIRARQSRGDASAYDIARLERELTLARGKLATESSALVGCLG